MPGYDGTGPRGQGPLTGEGRGFCLLKLPLAPDEPISGFAGRSGYSVRVWPPADRTDLEALRTQIMRIETAIRGMNRRLTALEAWPSETGHGPAGSR